MEPAGAVYGGAQPLDAHMSDVPNLVHVKVTRATFVVWLCFAHLAPFLTGAASAGAATIKDSKTVIAIAILFMFLAYFSSWIVWDVLKVKSDL